MRRYRAAGSIPASILVIFLCMCVLLPGQAFPKSGIRIKQGITPDDATDPPPAELKENIYYFKVKNKNQICDEAVKINLPIGGFKNDPLGTPLFPRGDAAFLGLKRNLSDPYSSSLSYEQKDETTKTIYLGVETNEDSNGCDFQGFQVTIRICDTGPHGLFTCDDWHSDKPCESPTPHAPQLLVKAEELPPPTGSGTIEGIVTKLSTGAGLLAAISIKKVGACVVGGPDNTDIYSGMTATHPFPPDKGEYEAVDLPYGNYKVTAIVSGLFITKSAMVSSPVPVVVDFQF